LAATLQQSTANPQHLDLDLLYNVRSIVDFLYVLYNKIKQVEFEL